MSTPYGETILEHFRRPRNRGVLQEPSVAQEGTNPLCGDRVRIELRLEGDLIREAAFTANACAICVASASVLTELVRGAPLEDAATLAVTDLLGALDAEVPAARMPCMRLPLTVLHAAILLHDRRAS